MAARRNPLPYRGCGWQGCHAWNGRTAIEGRVDGSREAFPAGTVRPIPAANARRRIRRIGAYVFLSRWKAEIGTQLKRQCPGHPIFVRAPALRVIGRSEARNRVRQLVEGLRQRILRPVVVNDFVLQHHQVRYAPEVGAHQPLARRRAREDEAGHGRHQNRGRAYPNKPSCLVRKFGWRTAKLVPVIAKDRACHDEDCAHLKNEARGQITAHEIVNQCDEVADDNQRGQKQRHVEQPSADR